MNQEIKGNLVDSKSRCVHYHSTLDIVAIRMKCCNHFYACIHCHNTLESHEPILWGKKELDSKAILCGECLSTYTIDEYLNCNNECPNCKALFNPKCSNHYHYYFEQ
jgi:uncharacterized CHY-type Zn-finger protein